MKQNQNRKIAPQFIGWLLGWGIGLAILGSPVAAISQNPPARPFDILHYDLRLTISDQNDTLRGVAVISLRAQRRFTRIHLDFAGLHATLIEMNHTPLEYHETPKGLDILLNERTAPGELLQLKMSYVGKPRDGLIIRKNKYGRRTFFADNWPNRAHFWFPCFDHPSDKATVRFQITAPYKYSIVANGRLQSRRNNLDGMQTVVYDEAVPIPTYCMVFGAAEFEVYYPNAAATVPLSFWIFPQDIRDALHDFRRSNNMLKYYRQRFGRFPYEKLSLVQSSTRFGGMENASAIFFAERSIGTPRNIEGTAAHEIVHQWFGDFLTIRDWSQLWLSEGFATYFGMQYFEYADGADSFRVKLRRSRARYLSRKKWTEQPIITQIPENLYDLLNPNNYTKGGWVLHMLRRLVGEEVFWKGIRTYVANFGGGNVTTRDFRETMETVYGKSLEWFFRQWIYQGGIPELEITYFWDRATKNERVRVRQLQKGPAMKLPLELAFYGPAVVHKMIWLKEKEKQFVFYFSEPPEKLVVDPGVDLLAKYRVKQAVFPVEKPSMN